MKIYLKTGRRNHLMFLTPGMDSDASDFKNADGTNKQFTIRFVDGRADVPSNVGQYLLSKGVVQRTAIIEPKVAQQIVAQEERVRNHRFLTSLYHEGA